MISPIQTLKKEVTSYSNEEIDRRMMTLKETIVDMNKLKSDYKNNLDWFSIKYNYYPQFEDIDANLNGYNEMYQIFISEANKRKDTIRVTPPLAISQDVASIISQQQQMNSDIGNYKKDKLIIENQANTSKIIEEQSELDLFFEKNKNIVLSVSGIFILSIVVVIIFHALKK